MFIAVSRLVPLFLYLVLPKALLHFGYNDAKQRSLLAVACILFLVSWYLPSPLIDGMDTSFTTHFVGGGLFCGLLWLYLYKTLKCRWPVWLQLISLFALVSMLGTVNELFELVIVQLGLVDIQLIDTSWDLFANTLGSAVFYALYKLVQRLR